MIKFTSNELVLIRCACRCLIHTLTASNASLKDKDSNFNNNEVPIKDLLKILTKINRDFSGVDYD